VPKCPDRPGDRRGPGKRLGLGEFGYQQPPPPDLLPQREQTVEEDTARRDDQEVNAHHRLVSAERPPPAFAEALRNPADDLEVEEPPSAGQPHNTVRDRGIEEGGRIARQQVAQLARTPTDTAQVALEDQPGNERRYSGAPHQPQDEEASPALDITRGDDLGVEDGAQGEGKNQEGDDLPAASTLRRKRSHDRGFHGLPYGSEVGSVPRESIARRATSGSAPAVELAS